MMADRIESALRAKIKDAHPDNGQDASSDTE